MIIIVNVTYEKQSLLDLTCCFQKNEIPLILIFHALCFVDNTKGNSYKVSIYGISSQPIICSLKLQKCDQTFDMTLCRSSKRHVCKSWLVLLFLAHTMSLFNKALKQGSSLQLGLGESFGCIIAPSSRSHRRKIVPNYWKMTLLLSLFP